MSDSDSVLALSNFVEDNLFLWSPVYKLESLESPSAAEAIAAQYLNMLD